MLVARKIMPWYDERFRGYGWDKVCAFTVLRVVHRLANKKQSC